MKNNFGFILIKPQLGENIGASARSMKNFGFSKLRIVSPKFSFPNHKAKVTSVGAFDIISKTKILNSTQDAVKEYDIVFAFSARRRDINKKHISIDNFKKILTKKKNCKFGLMFGPEASGLSNFDLSYSNYILQIPTSNKFKSLNLSHSVTVICYEIFRLHNENLFKRNKGKLRTSSKSKVNSFMKHLIYLLENKNFFDHKEKKQSMLLNINNLIYRLEPNDKELRILASIISSLGKKNFKP